MDINHVVAEQFREFADKLDSDDCRLSLSEYLYLLSQIAHIELNKTEAADLLGISTRTFDRKILAGELPEGQHIRGSKSLIWYKDELINHTNN